MKSEILPRWLKTRQAIVYSSIGKTRLKQLAMDGKIDGYKDPESNRGDWVFDRISIDNYRMLPLKNNNIEDKKIIERLCKSL